MITIVTKTRKKRTNHFGGKKMKKKLLSVMLVGALAISALTGCGSKETASDDSQKTGTTTEADSSSDAADTSDFDTSEMINVQSREDGSGTRGAFIELFGIEEKDADGNKQHNRGSKHHKQYRSNAYICSR
jgi:phosphate transport system substrate-binding protein